MSLHLQPQTPLAQANVYLTKHTRAALYSAAGCCMVHADEEEDLLPALSCVLGVSRD